MSLPGNVQDMGANAQKTDVVTWKRAGLGCQRAKNRCRYLETCRTWVPTCKKPCRFLETCRTWVPTCKKPCRFLETCRTWVPTGKKLMSLPGNVLTLGANVQKCISFP